MSDYLFRMTIKLGNDAIQAGVMEHRQAYELYYSIVIPGICDDKHYYLFLEPYGDVHFIFDKEAPSELRKYEGTISKAIFNYHY